MGVASLGSIVKIGPKHFVGRPDSDGGVGTITVVHEDGTFDLRYTVEGRLEKNVDPERITDLSPLVLLARNTNGDGVDRPSILAPTHRPIQQERVVSPAATAPTSPRGASDALLRSNNWSRYDKTPNPLLSYLHKGRAEPKGWLRIVENEYDKYQSNKNGKKKGEMAKQLSAAENQKIVTIKKEIDRLHMHYSREWPNGFTPVADLAHAYGVGQSKVRGCVNAFLQKNCSAKRKVRSDEGQTIFNSDKKRKTSITGYTHYKKLQRKNHPGEIITDAALKANWEKLSAAAKHECELGAVDELKIAASLEAVVKEALEKTNGSITWDRLASEVAGGEGRPRPSSKTAIRRYVMATPGFHYFVTRTLPQCTTEHTIHWRRKWSISFHIFWEGAKLVAGKVQVLYFHIDEKWFYSLVIRKNNKCVPAWGVQGVWNRIHHANAIEKILCICAMAFEPEDNDIRKGGKAHKLTITRCGGMVKAKKDSYSRVYRPDGTYHYPKVPENLLRQKDKEYFENWEITGSKESEAGTSKYALTNWLKDVFLQALKDKCAQLEAEHPGKRIHVRGQWDNASPHVERKLLGLIEELFEEKGWVWTTQPANSPLTNIMDAAIFPALAKKVTEYQGIDNGGRYLQCEQLWNTVVKAWDNYPLAKIARAFIHHGQVAAAIYNCDGRDDFVKERNGLSFGVRKVCKLFYGDGYEGDEDAIDLTSLAPSNRVAKGVIVDEMPGDAGVDTEKQLKYPLPDMSQHSIEEYLSYDELALIAGDPRDVDYDNFSDSQKERYDKFAEAWAEKQGEPLDNPFSGSVSAPGGEDIEVAAV